MISSFLRPHTLAVCIAACLAGGLGSDNVHAVTVAFDKAASAQLVATGTQRYIVRFAEAPLALQNRALKAAQTQMKSAAAAAASQAMTGQALPGIGAIPSRTKANGRRVLDTQSSQARAYLSTLAARQGEHQQAIEKAIGRPANFLRTYKHAFNGVVMNLSVLEAEKIKRLPGIAAVEVDRARSVNDDVSSRFIGASAVWLGGPSTDTTPGYSYPTLQNLFGVLNTPYGFKGDGIVVGVIDTGYNSLSPSYQATDGSGYTITNPLGSGTYLGDCGIAGISFGGCNDKVIAVYDEYSRAFGETGVTVEDANEHGSHTSSTAAGNARSGGFAGFSANFSGIAPHANLVIYAITPPGGRTTVNSSILSSVEDTLTDGIVDVLNLSFGGSNEPDYWHDATAQAFLAAADQGIFTAQSAGNTESAGDVAQPGSVGNDEPWVTTVAATTDTGGVTPFYFSITGPGTPPSATQKIVPTEGTYDTPLAQALPATTPIVLSPEFDPGDIGSSTAPSHGSDGCNGYPDGIFADSIALVSRGVCSFSVKVNNAIASGAIAVVIADNRVEGPFSPTAGPPVVPVPVYSVLQSQGAALQSFLKANKGAGTASLGYQSARAAQQADVLADFSLLGPIALNVIKPDIAAPGVAILAAVNNATVDENGVPVETYGADAVGFLDGTSMASPHIAGAAALVMGVHPDWTPMEVKSALMMTANQTGVTKVDGKTPADFYDVGSGRVSVYDATQVGLVLDESSDNFNAADPNAGGDASSLNLASMQNSSCVNSCTFTRTFRSTLSKDKTWFVQSSGALAQKISVTPSNFSVKAGATVALTITVNTTGLTPGDGFHFGQIMLGTSEPYPQAQNVPDLHLPISVAVPAPALAVPSNTVTIDLDGKATGSATLDVSNSGGGIMQFQAVSSGTGSLTWAAQSSGNSYGQYSTNNTGMPDGWTNFYVADDFVLTGGGVNLSSIVTPGFTINHNLASFGSGLALHWRVYADKGGVPAGNPDTNDVAAWSYDATAGSPGVSVAGDTISLDLIAAQQTTNLSAGKYWLVVYPDLPCNASGNSCTESWVWFNSWQNTGSTFAGIAPEDTDSGQWAVVPDETAGPGLAMTITSAVACGATPSWLSLTPSPGTITAGATTAVTFTATAAKYAPAESASSYICLGGGYQEPVLGSLIPLKGLVPIQVNANN